MLFYRARPHIHRRVRPTKTGQRRYHTLAYVRNLKPAARKMLQRQMRATARAIPGTQEARRQYVGSSRNLAQKKLDAL